MTILDLLASPPKNQTPLRYVTKPRHRQSMKTNDAAKAFHRRRTPRPFSSFSVYSNRHKTSKAGMRFLIQSFYQSIIEGRPVPIPYREILLTSRIIDAIFRKCERSATINVDGLQESALMPPSRANAGTKLAGS